jgi:F-type H+-transporting ATPase subunit a
MPELGQAITYNLRVPTPLLMSWVTVLILIGLSFAATRRLQTVPSGLQAIFELAFGFIFNLVDETVGADGRRLYPLFLGLFFFILVGNLIGLVPGLMSPTSNLSTTAALALIVFASIHALGVKKHGVLGYVKHMTAGVPWWLKPLMLVIEVIGELARPLSLAFRLFGNIMAKEVLLGILAFLVLYLYQAGGVIDTTLTIVPLLLRPLIILLGVLVSFLQAYIFTMLSVAYIGSAVKVHSEGSH